MTSASLDRLLALLIAAVVLTGAVTLRAGTPVVAWIFMLHALAAGSLAAAVVLKLGRSLPAAVKRRKWRALAIGLLVTGVAAAGLGGGYLWVLSGERPSLAGFTVMTLHAWAGLVLIPVLTIHLVPRRWRLLRPGARVIFAAAERVVSRRGLLVAVGFGAVAAGLTSVTDLLDAARSRPRRFTGSRFLPPDGVPPTTTFLFDRDQPIDPSGWRLSVGGSVPEPLILGLDDLAAIATRELRAVLDCTSGWALETTWHGTPLSKVLDAVGLLPTASTVTVRATTGWSTTLALDEARGCLLATSVAGRPLPVANGAPCRLVVPTRRGLDWVKWVTEIEVA